MEITINSHSSIRIKGEKTLWFDPFQIKKPVRDAEVILLTHDHYDHFSAEDIAKAAAPGAVFVAPKSMERTVAPYGKTVALWPGDFAMVEGVRVEAIPAYNPAKRFHPRKNDYLGYVVELEGQRIYVCGDTDVTPEALAVQCDILLAPVGGTYTMTAAEAARLANAIRPRLAIPTHYGSIVGRREDGENFRRMVDKEINVELKVEDAI